MKKLKFAIIGCGRIADRHIDALETHKDEAELVAVCDLNQGRAVERSRGKYKVYTNYYEMLSKEDIDVINIMTPSGMHPFHVIDVIKNFKKHVVVEKPMALKVEDAEEMIKVAKENNVQLHVVHQNRFNKATKKLKELCEENAFGKKSMGTVRLRWARGQGYYDRDPWRGTWALDGGALTNQAIHHIDLLYWLIGEIECVSANSSTRLVNVEVEDTAVAWVKFKDGTLGVIEAMTSVRPDDLEASVSILGENGSIIVEGTSVNKFSYSSFTKEDLNQYSEFPPNVYGFGHDHFMKTVIDAVNGKAAPVIPGEEGIKAVKLLNAIYSSIETGKTVYLKDNPVSKKLGVFNEKTLPIKALYTTEKK